MKVMERLPIIITLGAGLLGFLAGQLLATDPALEDWLREHVPRPQVVFGAIGAIVVVVVGRWLHHRQTQVPDAV
jgi:predicted tellurium resistance membrane protein TerC